MEGFPVQWDARSGAGITWNPAAMVQNGLIFDSVPVVLPGKFGGGGGGGGGEMMAGISTNTCSLDSLDCLLSVSNESASAEDDAVSMMFSHCNPLWDSSSSQMPNQFAAVDPGRNPAKRRRSASEETEPESRTQHPNLDFLQFSYPPPPERPRSENISFLHPSSSSSSAVEPDAEAIAQMKEMIYRAAAFRPVNFESETIDKPKRKNVRISSDPQTVAARQRREKISDRIRILQKLVPGGSKMDTASMLDEAANYLKFLRSQVKALEAMGLKMESYDSLISDGNMGLSSPFFNSAFSMEQSQFSIQNVNLVDKSKS